MKKDLQNNKISFCGLLFLFFFSFTVTEGHAQTEVSSSPDVITYNGQKYNVDGHLSGFTFLTGTAAATVFLNEAQSLANVSYTTQDDFLHVEAGMKSEYYKRLHRDVTDGASVSEALKNSIFGLQDLTTSHYANYSASVPRPNLVEVFTEAVQLVAQ